LVAAWNARASVLVFFAASRAFWAALMAAFWAVVVAANVELAAAMAALAALTDASRASW
jgi:hypothetical protein